MDLAEPVSLEDHLKGRFDAKLTLVQYGDYECPYTRLSRRSVHALQRELGDQLRFVFRHFPLEPIHSHARSAAAAAEAAAAQGEFWSMHEYLFDHQRALEAKHLHAYAVDLGLDPDRFERDRASREITARIDRDLSSGGRSGVEGTPTFFINSRRHEGPYTVESLRAAIEAERSRKQDHDSSSHRRER
jgi:protein-disulfide isomerase